MLRVRLPAIPRPRTSTPAPARIALAAALVALGSSLSAAAAAQAYKPDDFLTLDLAKAVLSPVPLGPPSHFEPYAVEAKTDARTEPAPAATAGVDTAPAVAEAPTERAGASHPAIGRAAHGHRQYAEHHRNPLDAQASLRRPHPQARVQSRVKTWPCNTGGICSWR